MNSIDQLANALEAPFDTRLDAETARSFVDAFAAVVDSSDNSPTIDSTLDRALDRSAHPNLLEALSEEDRLRWTDLALKTIRRRNHRLEDLMAWRVESQPLHPLFEERMVEGNQGWSYQAIQRRARTMAAALLQIETTAQRPLRVALWTANSIEGASVDLACLMHDIFVTPLSTHLNTDEVAWILERLSIDVVLADRDERLRRLMTIAASAAHPFKVIALGGNHALGDGRVQQLDQLEAKIGVDRAAVILDSRPRIGIDEPCTAMFTSGSTGRPKGVMFTPFNLISKRYARAAALPSVGRDERMLCYLPLFHTFGRYLEMLGTIYWRGTYVFAGNPSAESLLAGLREIHPTGLISVPARWQQIRDAADERIEAGEDPLEAVRAVTGGSLRWGLSAAGYLDPRTFHFFQRHGLELCSGFGMTEATGGITMSPPGDYLEDTVGRPLPGIEIEFDEIGEMRIGGPYVAQYLREDGHELEVEPFEQIDGRPRLRTGDVFRVLDRGHVQIVDRVKDIYKNNRGQTVAPRRVEDQFSDVPGIRRVFLVGDHRPWNALLVVPDLDDPLLKDAPDEHSRHEYFGHVIAAANLRLVPFERVVNYVLIDRDFEVERDELTPKGSFRRKNIEQNFAEAIEELYRHPYLERIIDGLTVRIPQWLARDLGALDANIVASDHALIDETRELSLRICRLEAGRVQVGDLVYRIAEDLIDLGRLSRQPELWMGNTELLAFVPCKDGWDVPFGDFDEFVALPEGAVPDEDFAPVRASEGIDRLLLECNDLVQTALHAPTEAACTALDELARLLGNTEHRLDHAIRQRLTLLALHDDTTRRCEAYRVLLMDEPTAHYNEAFGPFVDSGKSFLNRSTIRRIASERFGRRRLEALRQRLAVNRSEGEWPTSSVARGQFLDVLRLLVDFAREQPENYHPVRCELASWIVHRDDPELAHRASELLEQLVTDFESRLLERLQGVEALRDDQIMFDDDILESARQQQRQLLATPAFLVQSIQLAYNEPDFDPRDIVEGGLWISSRGPHDESGGTFRWSIHTQRGRHYQLLVVARKDLAAARVLETNYRMVAIGGHPFGERVLPRFGCARPDLGAMSLEYIDDLSVEERIRRAVGAARSGGEILGTLDWRHLYIRGMGAVISAWQNSGRRLVPRLARPSNIVVPAIDFREGARVLTLSGWEEFRRPADLLVPLWTGFYPRVYSHHPECREWIDPAWIGDAVAESIGAARALEFLGEAVANCELPSELRSTLESVLESEAIENHVPLVIELAIGRFHTWQEANPEATIDARTDQVSALIRLYAIARLGEAARAELFRHTVFADAPEACRVAFDQLLDALRTRPETSVTQRVELSELQATLDDEHRHALSRMVFPHARRRGGVDVLTFGEPGHERVTVGTTIVDREDHSYQVREPIAAEEVGQVYRLFYREHFARAASEADQFLVVLDRDQRVVAALIHREESAEVTHIDGFVVRSSMSGRGIASALLEDFCARATGRGRRVAKTSFILREFCERRGFRVDRRWGGLVRFLEADDETAS